MNRREQPELFEYPAMEDRNDVYLSPGNLRLTGDTANVYELSVDAFYALFHARMSCLPIEGEISRFIEKVCKAGRKISDGKITEDRAAAEQAASDLGDPDVLTVLKAAGKVQHEIHRIMGLLRFSAGTDGVYTARCAPFYCILPALAEHFCLRFGQTPWSIIDEKRDLCLCRQKDGEVRLIPGPAHSGPQAAPSPEKEDHWENLWRLYHRCVNNEGRKNLRLQRQFMPKRYHEYLVELK